MNVQPSRLLAQCPLCQATYQDAEIKLVGENGATKLFHCRCQTCGQAMLAVILESSGWVSSVGLVTDLEAKDALQFQAAAPVSSDECVQMHQFLEQNSADFCKRVM